MVTDLSALATHLCSREGESTYLKIKQSVHETPMGIRRKERKKRKKPGGKDEPSSRLDALASHVLELHNAVEPETIDKLICRGCDDESIADTRRSGAPSRASSSTAPPSRSPLKIDRCLNIDVSGASPHKLGIVES